MTQFSELEKLRMLTAFGKLTSEVIKLYGFEESLVVTNDWTGGLVAKHCRSLMPGVKFVHIVHNLDEGYQGITYVPRDQAERVMNMTGLKDEELEYQDTVVRINPSLVALQKSDSWGTVSRTYLRSLLTREEMFSSRFPQMSFGWSNGIDRDGVVSRIKQNLKLPAGKDLGWETHLQAKRFILKQYFSEEGRESESVLVSTIGRITQQKQSFELLEAIEELVKTFGTHLKILIAGNDSPSDPYGAQCRELCAKLRKKYPIQFWGDPSQFFSEHKHELLHGSNFGLMYSKFEPGGLVQLEYLAAQTPVLVTKTGGLLDTVQDLTEDYQVGNGYFIEPNSQPGLAAALSKALLLYRHVETYKNVRERMYHSALDVDSVSEKYLHLFYTTMHKIYSGRSPNSLGSDFDGLNSSVRHTDQSTMIQLELPPAVSAETVIAMLCEVGYSEKISEHQMIPTRADGSSFCLRSEYLLKNHHILFMLDGKNKYVCPTLMVDTNPQLGTCNLLL